MPVYWKRKLNNEKWILTLMITLYHIQYPYADTASFRHSAFIYVKDLADCIVPAFSLISGYLFFYNAKSIKIVWEKMNRRIYTLFLPYICWNIINSFYLILKGGGRYNEFIHYNWVRGIFSWDASPHFWYVFMLMFWTVLAPGLFFCFNKKTLTVIFVGTQIFYFIYMGNDILTSRFCYILFTWGGIIGIYIPNIVERICCIFQRIKYKYFAIASLIVFYIAVYAFYGSIQNNLVRVFFYGIRAVVLIIVGLNISELKIGQKTQFAFSFWLFAIHYHADDMFSGVLSRIQLPIFVYQVGTWIAVVAFGLISGMLLKRIFPKMYNLLSGNRKIY